MKKVLAFMLLCVATLSLNAQTCCSKDSTAFGKYTELSVSMANGAKLSTACYFTAEAGVTTDNISMSIGVGRRRFAKGVEQDLWFVEPKACFTLLHFGKASGYITTGVGSFVAMKSPTYFIEYGGGVIIPVHKTDCIVQMSNWAGSNYVSLGISKSF